MGEHVVGHVRDIPEGEGRVVELEGRSIGVFNVGGKFYALRNRCPHQGGPLCTGKLFPTVRAEVVRLGKVREFLDFDNMVICCPWHGWEFDVRTGTCLADPERRVASYETKVHDDKVIVVLR